MATKKPSTTASKGFNWECPICLHVYPREIYQCSNGHSICSLCMNKVKVCPTCRVEIGSNKIRNRLAEEMLDAFKFSCDWKGCIEKLSRIDISKHKEQCPHNPNGLKICHFFNTSKSPCNFQFTMESLQEPPGIEQFLEHMSSVHGYQEQSIKPGNQILTSASLELLKSMKSNPAQNYPTGIIFTPNIISMEYNNRKHLFLHLISIDMNGANQEMFSLMMTQLTPDAGLPHSFTVNHVFKVSSGLGTISRLDPASKATTTWSTKPMKMDQFVKYYVKHVAAERPLIPCPILLSHLEQYFVGQRGEIEYGFSITTN